MHAVRQESDDETGHYPAPVCRRFQDTIQGIDDEAPEQERKENAAEPFPEEDLQRFLPAQQKCSADSQEQADACPDQAFQKVLFHLQPPVSTRRGRG